MTSAMVVSSFEVEDGLQAQAAYSTQFAVAGYPCDERAEDQRRDDDFDEPEKNVAEDFDRNGDVWGIESEFDAGEHAEKDPASQGTRSKRGNSEE